MMDFTKVLPNSGNMYRLCIEFKIIQSCSKNKIKMKKMLLHGKGFKFFLIAFSQTV